MIFFHRDGPYLVAHSLEGDNIGFVHFLRAYESAVIDEKSAFVIIVCRNAVGDRPLRRIQLNIGKVLLLPDVIGIFDAHYALVFSRHSDKYYVSAGYGRISHHPSVLLCNGDSASYGIKERLSVGGIEYFKAVSAYGNNDSVKALVRQRRLLLLIVSAVHSADKVHGGENEHHHSGRYDYI